MNKIEEKANQPMHRKRILLVLPLLCLPFLTMIFWALGGGGKVEQTAAEPQQLNTTLPDADFSGEKPQDKMAVYESAAADSQRRSMSGQRMAFDQLAVPSDTESQHSSETQIYQKLEALNRTINEPATPPVATASGYGYSARSQAPALSSADVDRLEQMMKSMSKPAEQDPEMVQLNGVLDKILDIQNPSRVQEAIRAKSEQQRGQVFAVSTVPCSDPISVLEKPLANAKTEKSNGFFSLERQAEVQRLPNAIQAVVHGSQTLVSGSTVKLRLETDVFVNGVQIPRSAFLYGQATLSGERLTIRITSISYQHSLYPVSLMVTDQDGIDGIYVPGAISREVAKQSAEQGLQGLGLTTMDPSLATQAASVGVEAVKGFFNKKVKLIRVTVKSGYQILLRDENQQQ